MARAVPAFHAAGPYFGVTVGILQQITGINAVFYYAPMIFEQSGIGTNAAFMQAVLWGLPMSSLRSLPCCLTDRLGGGFC